MTDSLLDALRSVVGDHHVLTDADVRRGHETDWTGRYAGDCVAVVRPGSTAEVAAVLRVCTEEDTVVVTQGGNTGLVGGGVPRPAATTGRSIVLSTRRLAEIGPVDADSMQVTVGAGATLAEWRGLAARPASTRRSTSPLATPPRSAARSPRTPVVRGVLRFGTMRNQIAGIEAVLAGGEVVGSLAGLPKETAGVHWPSVLAGSEGTLAVVTRARLRVVPLFEHTVTAIVATRSVDDAVAVVGQLRRAVPSLDAAEVVQPEAMALVGDHLGVLPPVTAPPAGSYVVVDCADHTDPTGQLAAVLDRPDVSALVVDVAVATDETRRARLLAFRDRITEAIAAASTAIGTPTFKLDVAVPLAMLGELLDVAQRAATADGARLIAFGHLAEGNLHLNHLGATDPDAIAADVLPAVAALGGTISAEHGIGIAKAKWLPLVRSDADLAAQAAIRSALDPRNILNRGVLDPAQPQVP